MIKKRRPIKYQKTHPEGLSFSPLMQSWMQVGCEFLREESSFTPTAGAFRE